jgi:hypothetical protein
MFVLRVSVDPPAEGGVGNLDEPLRALLEGPLLSLEGVNAIEGVYVALDRRSAFVPLVVADDIDLPTAIVGASLLDAAVAGVGDSVAQVEVFMAAPMPGACPICAVAGDHDWSKHTANVDYAGGLTRL